MLDFPPARLLLSYWVLWSTAQEGMRPSSSQFDGVELIWMFFSAELNLSC